MRSNIHRRNSGGFTLIELMIVVTIIAILAAIMIPNFLRARAQGQLTACKSNLRNIATACEMYAADHRGENPPDLDTLTTPTGVEGEEVYMTELPTCPLDADEAGYSYALDTDGKPGFTLTCPVGHDAVGVTKLEWVARTGLVENAP